MEYSNCSNNSDNIPMVSSGHYYFLLPYFLNYRPVPTGISYVKCIKYHAIYFSIGVQMISMALIIWLISIYMDLIQQNSIDIIHLETSNCQVSFTIMLCLTDRDMRPSWNVLCLLTTDVKFGASARWVGTLVCCHRCPWSNGLRPRKLYTGVAVTTASVRVPIQRSFVPSFTLVVA